MMNFRKLFVIGAAVAALGVAGASMAQTNAQKSMIDEAKVEGVVGEQADGYLGFVSGSADAATTAAVNAINAGRADVYAQTAAKSGTTREAAGQATGAQLIARTPAGQFVKPLGGAWSRK